MLDISTIRDTVSKYAAAYGAEKVFLFGSYARGEANEKSDVDLRIDKGSITGGIALAGMLLDIQDDLGVNVDMVTTGSLTPDFLAKIQKEEKVLYER